MEDEEEEGELMRKVPSETVTAIIPSCHMRLGLNLMFFPIHSSFIKDLWCTSKAVTSVLLPPQLFSLCGIDYLKGSYCGL